MKLLFIFFFLFIFSFQVSSQSVDCALVSYKNYKNNESGVISFCFNNSNTLIINNYNVNNKDQISALLLTPNGVEIRESETSWKKDYKPMLNMPSENSVEFQNFKVQYIKLTDGTLTAKIWFTNEIKFFNSQNYWLFYGELGKMIQQKYAGSFPIAMQLIENSSEKTLYEHIMIGKENIQAKPEAFKPIK